MESHGETYDVFVSYSHKDEQWVNEELLPRLLSFKISVCIDRTHFIEGQPVDSELHRLVRMSRQSLLVLTSNWVASNFTDYELQLMLTTESGEDYERFLPLRIDQCEIPRTLEQFQIIDSEQLGWSGMWRVLQQALLVNKIGPSGKRLAAELAVSKHPSTDPTSHYAYCYVCRPLVANINAETLEFDSVDIEFEANDFESKSSLKAVRINRSEEGDIVNFSYHGSEYFAGLRRIGSMSKADRLISLSLDPYQARTLNDIRLDYAPVSLPGKKVVCVSLCLRRFNQPVTERCLCALPPVVRMPDFKPNEGRQLNMASEQFLPKSSGVLDQRLRKSVFNAAAKHISDSLLIEIAPRLITRHDLTSRSGIDPYYSCDDWRFIFHSNQRSEFFGIHSSDPASTHNLAYQEDQWLPTAWLHEEMLKRCKIDCATAYLMALTIEATPVSNNPVLRLEPIKLEDGLWRPVWKLPFQLRDLPIGVLADTCEVITLFEGAWRKPEGVIWNTY